MPAFGSGASVLNPGGSPRALPIAINSIHAFGHSYVDNQQTGSVQGTTLINDNFLFLNIFANAIGLSRERVFNHAITGSNLMGANMSRAQGGPARLLSETGSSLTLSTTNVGNTSGPGGPIQIAPFVRNAQGCAVLCWGINDIGETSPANQAALLAGVQNEMIALVSKWRASAVYLAGNTTQWTFGTNFTASTVGAGNSSDWTSGKAMQASAVDSSGTSTATFTIPAGYKGEPICFCMTASQSNTLAVTWGGTIATTGPFATTGIVGLVTTLMPTGSSNNFPIGVRFTAAANGLSPAHAGQTITVRVTSLTGATFFLDGAWIESFKPNPVIICNVPRLACRTYNLQFGDGVGAGTTTFTSATGNFRSANAVDTDVGISVTEIDGGTKIPAGTVINSVTNATTVVLNNTVASGTSIQYQIARVKNGYNVSFYGTNTHFSAATPANHALADQDILNWNAMLATVQGIFGSMVQIADLDSALGQGDQLANIPSNVYTLWDDNNNGTEGFHPNAIGHTYCAAALMRAAQSLSEESDGQPFGVLEASAVPTPYDGPVLHTIVSGQFYMPAYTRLELATSAPATGYPTAITLGTAGNMWAMRLPFITASNVIAMAAFVYQQNAPATSGGNIRVGIYSDCNRSGYPQTLIFEVTSGGAFALGTTAGSKSVGTMNYFAGFTGTNLHYGACWVVIKVDSLGTTNSILASITGPSPDLAVPNAGSLFTSGTSLAMPFGPIAWQVTGVAAGALPAIFPAFANATLVSTAPAVALQLGLV